MGNPYIGEIRMFAGNFAPAGWAFCWGQLIPIAENDALFVLIGTTYGGDGQETFALPNLAARIPMHRVLNGTPVLAEMGGVEEVTLTTNQTPVHNHAFLATTGLANQGTPGGVTTAQSGTVQLFTEDTAAASLAAQAVQPVGGSQPHDNMHPYQCVSFIISLFGLFPRPT